MKICRVFRMIWILLLLACVATRAWSADNSPQSMIRAHLEPSGPVVAGSQIKLVVDCLTTTWFTEAPDWPLFTVPGAIVSLPDEQAENLHEVINGVDWFGVSRAYRIVPQNSGAFAIPPFAVTVQPGQASGPVKLMTPLLQFAATVPAGAEGMHTFFPAQKLVATQTVEPSPKQVRVGDQITRTVTQHGAGTQSMLIPPVNFSDVAGLKRYPKTATTHDIVQDRAGLVAGVRTDAVTYVADHGGKFTLPAITIEWWNTATQKKETIVLPAVTLSAVTATEKPLFAIPVDALSKGAAHHIIVIERGQAIWLGLLLTGALVLIWAYPRLLTFYGQGRRYVVAARRRYAEGSARAWRALRRASREGSPQHIIPALYRWMDQSHEFEEPARLDRLARLDEKNANELDALAEAVNGHYSNQPTAPVQWTAAPTSLRRAVKRARKARKADPLLPPLNRY
jgi:hypothetical protein